MNKRLAELLTVGTACFVTACERAAPSSESQMPSSSAVTTPVLRVSMLSDGTVHVEGSPTSLTALDSRFAGLAKDGGVVWYYRENPTADPHPNAMSVMELVVKHGLPISMSSKPDFSDQVDSAGASQPRR